MTKISLPPQQTPGKSASAPPTVALGLFVGFVLSTAFVALVAVVIPGVLLMVVAGLGMLVFFVLQYFLWARWLYPVVIRMESAAERQESVRSELRRNAGTKVDS